MITDHCSQFMISHENRLLHSHEDFDATLHSQEFKLACHWQKKPTASFQENSMFQLALHCAIGLWIISAPWSCNKCSTIFHHIFKQSSDDSAHKNSSRIHNIHIIHSSHTSSWLFIPQQLDGHFGEDKVLRCFEWFEQEDSFLLVVEATWTPFTTKRIEGNQSENRPSQKDIKGQYSLPTTIVQGLCSFREPNSFSFESYCVIHNQKNIKLGWDRRWTGGRRWRPATAVGETTTGALRWSRGGDVGDDHVRHFTNSYIRKQVQQNLEPLKMFLQTDHWWVLSA